MFDCKQVLIDYCSMDNTVLRLAIAAFAKAINQTSNINPFFESSTLPSLAQLVFKKQNLIPKTIPLIPYGGYGGHVPHSQIATLWLEFMRHTKYPSLQHAERGGEKTITLPSGRQVKVDGYVAEGKIVLEFYGCYYHKCPRCYASHRMDRTTGVFAGYTAEYTARREDEIRTTGHQVESIWECEFNRQLKTDEDLAKFVNEHPIQKALNPRDAYFGGRTEVFQMYAKADPTENRKIYYYDVVSLYPSVMLKNQYPVGLPDESILKQRFDDKALLEKWQKQDIFGVVACKVMPPKGLWLPLLPTRDAKSGKLMFGL